MRAYLSLPPAVYLLCLGTLINRAGSLVVPFLTLYLDRELALGPSFASWSVGILGAGALPAALVGGQLADQLGRKIVMVVSLAGSAVMLLVFSKTKAPGSILLATFVFSFITEMFRPAATAMLGDLVEPRQRVQAFSLMYVSINLGFAIAPALGGFLAERSYVWLFRVDAATALAYALIVLLFIRETLHAKHPRAGDDGPRIPVTRDAVSLRAAARQILGDRVFLGFFLASLLTFMVFSQAFSTLPLDLARQGYGPALYGRLIAINGVLIVLLQLPSSHFSQDWHRGYVMVGAALLTGAGYGAVPWAHTPTWVAATIVLWTLGEILSAPIANAIVTDFAPKALRGRYMGVHGLAFGLSMMIGAPLGGWTLEHHGSRTLWLGAAGIAGVSALLFWLLRAPLQQRRTAD